MAVLSVAVLLLLGALSSVQTSDLNMKTSEHALGEPCQDCTQIIDLLVDILSNADVQRGVMDGLDVLCDHLPNPSTAGKICRQQVEKMLPLAISFLTAAVQPEQLCSYLGLCGAHAAEEQTQRLMSLIQDKLRASAQTLELRDSPWAAEPGWLTDQTSVQCTYCLVLMDALQKMFPKEKTEGALVDLLQGACGLLPSAYESQCDALVDQLVRVVLDSLLSQATPRTICSLIQLCSASREMRTDPCTIQRSRCRDVRTALRCGTLSFCQRFIWKSARNTFL